MIKEEEQISSAREIQESLQEVTGFHFYTLFGDKELNVEEISNLSPCSNKLWNKTRKFSSGLEALEYSFQAQLTIISNDNNQVSQRYIISGIALITSDKWLGSDGIEYPKGYVLWIAPTIYVGTTDEFTRHIILKKVKRQQKITVLIFLPMMVLALILILLFRS